MSNEDILARAEDALRRHSRMTRLDQRARSRTLRSAKGRFVRIFWFLLGMAVAVPLWGLIVAPLGIGGILLAALIALVGSIFLLVFPRGTAGLSSDLPQTELAMLPLRTEEWLVDQRKMLPPPAQRLADGIGIKLEILSDQLRTLDDKEPAALEIRRLVAHELPELVNGYGRVPAHLRKNGLNGLNPDKQLIDGLSLVDSELQRMSEQLATGDLTKLATQGRYLELKYQGDTAS